MIQRCNALWMSQTPEEAASAAAAAAAAAVPSQQSPFHNSRRSPSPYRRKMSGGDKTGRRRSPTPGAAKGGRNDGLCFYHSRFGNKANKCEKGCSYQNTNRPAAGPHFAAAAGSIPACCPPPLFSTRINHSNVYFSNKKPNFPS